MAPDGAAAAVSTQGREAYEQRRWAEAYRLLREADALSPLDAPDLQRLAVAAQLIGNDDEGLAALERAHQSFLTDGDVAQAIDAAFWLAIALTMNRGETVRGGAWLARAQRLLQGDDSDRVQRGYLQLPVGLQELASGESESARDRFREAIACGERFEDRDLISLGRLGLGLSLVRLGEPAAGVASFDEAMISVITDETSPIVTGIVYCAVIETCQSLFDLRRAQEWTAALTRWCEAQPDIVPFRGQCLTYRSEILRLHGSWADALDEATRAYEILSQLPPHPAVGSTLYDQAEVLRLRGEFTRAEASYREASRWGRPPEPGLALLRLAQGRVDAAAASIWRLDAEAGDPVTRSRLLPAFVEIVLATGDVEAATRATDELAAIAEQLGAQQLEAAAAASRGRVLLANGDPQAAVAELRGAMDAWLALDVPYEVARVRVLIGEACAMLGDADASELEFDAARHAFRQLGATADLAALDGRDEKAPERPQHGLTVREYEVLRLVASGKTNHDIAAELVISEKTVARHVSNILAKLDVPSRAAATAYAYEHGLL